MEIELLQGDGATGTPFNNSVPIATNVVYQMNVYVSQLQLNLFQVLNIFNRMWPHCFQKFEI